MPSPDLPGSDAIALERRHALRKHVILRVQILADSRTLDAAMLDVSEIGAQLQLRAPAELPERFVLRFRDGTTRKAERRWVSGLRLGVHFLTGAVDPPAMAEGVGLDDIRSRIERLRGAELADLSRRLTAEDHFGSEEIRVAARDLDLSVERLRRAVASRMRG